MQDGRVISPPAMTQPPIPPVLESFNLAADDPPLQGVPRAAEQLRGLDQVAGGLECGDAEQRQPLVTTRFVEHLPKVDVVMRQDYRAGPELMDGVRSG